MKQGVVLRLVIGFDVGKSECFGGRDVVIVWIVISIVPLFGLVDVVRYVDVCISKFIVLEFSCSC